MRVFDIVSLSPLTLPESEDNTNKKMPGAKNLLLSEEINFGQTCCQILGGNSKEKVAQIGATMMVDLEMKGLWQVRYLYQT